MSAQETWGEAFDALWERLGTGETSLSRVMRYGLVFVLLAGAAWQMKSGHETLTELETPLVSVPLPVNIIGERGRVEELLRIFDGVMTLRLAGKDTVALMEATHRQPYRTTISDVAASVSAPMVEALPPIMSVRSIMILENRKAAVMDIETDGNGVIVTEGMKFDQGHGRILKIAKNKVVVAWMGTRMEIPIDPQ